MAAISNDWLEALRGEFKKPYYRQLFETVKKEYATHLVFPPSDDIFNAFHLTPLKDVKVVILGQDLTTMWGRPTACVFRFKREWLSRPPLSIFIRSSTMTWDAPYRITLSGEMGRQGVLMLNTVLTVRAHQANSHRGIGWEEFTDAAIKVLDEQDRPIVFILWGTPAQRKKTMLHNPRHLVLEAPHPSLCLHTEVSLAAGLSARPTRFLRRMVWNLLTGRLSRGIFMRDTYDLVIVGAGPGGYVAARKAASLGMSVALIDRGSAGGTCINRGCIPAKALLHAATLYREMTTCERFGLHAEGISFDLQKIYEYKDMAADRMREELEEEFRQLDVDLIRAAR